MGEFQKRVERAVVAFCGEPSKYDEALLREGADTFRSIASEITKEADDRIAALEAEKAERERQEPVAWVLFDDIFIAPKDMQDDPPNLECMKPLYAHPLALREPTEDECSRIYAIADRNPITRGPEIGEMPVRAGRAMWQAVREVMTK